MTLFPEEANPVPVIVIKVPPPVPPLTGSIDATDGVKALSYVKAEAD